MGVWVSLQHADFIFFGYINLSLYSQMGYKVALFLIMQEISIFVVLDTMLIYNPINWLWEFLYSTHHCQHFFKKYCCSKYRIKTYSGLISLMISDIQHFIIYLLAICVFSFQKCLFRSFSQYNTAVWFLTIEWLEFIIYCGN